MLSIVSNLLRNKQDGEIYILDDVRHGQRFLNIYQDSTGSGHTAHYNAQYDQGLCCPFTNILAIFTLKHENAIIHLLYRYIVSHAHTP